MADDETDVYHLLGILLRFLARPANGKGYCLVELLVAPGAGPPPNRHPSDDEAFYVLDGAFDFMVDGATRRVGRGDFVQVPNGAVHAFTNAGPAPGRLLVINAPGHAHVGFFSQAGEPMPKGTRDLPPPSGEPPDIPRLVEIGRRNGLEFLLDRPL
ncbi:MAG: cupin domain-containing protein [Geminicoccaceae bacterium]|nr:cupin domain-containing protein [Geminicoccaceae bacterium]